MAISASDVMKLRKATGAGMMDCKKALAETDGDFDAAIKIIREKGKAIANKRADREATEGVVIAKVDGNKAGLVVLNCETDFVAKNQGFIDFAGQILDASLAADAKNLDEAKAVEMDGRTADAQVTEQTGIIGEKLELSHYDVVEGESVVAYIHPGNKLATIVAFNKGGVDAQIGKDVAMQIAAMNPVAIDKDDVPESVANEELEIAKEKFRQQGKPENMLDKIAQGALNKFFKESTLLNQAFVKDSKKTIAQYLSESDKDLTVTAFKRYSLGD